MAGRKPTPTQQKKLRGNPGKRPLNTNEPEMQAIVKIPKPPTYLSPAAKKEWKQQAKLLMEARVLTAADVSSFELYCVSYGKVVDTEKMIRKHGMFVRDPRGGIMANPAIDLQLKLLSHCRQFMTEFGLTPSSRSRIHVAPAEKKDEFGDFLNGK
ncbi:MAG: phage terminase small subunit P27 family [Desulfobulbaceae bacterium]|nr:phage terminase small subunit P27 family [Desulfobulbaceae bacterium]